jgi:hypothetical protein
VRTLVVNMRQITAPGQAIYVGRRCMHRLLGWLEGHPLANPYKLPPDAGEDARRECLEMYNAWLTARLQTPAGAAEMHTLARQVKETGLPLGCWCSPLACHADTLAAAVDALLSTKGIR